MRPKKPRNKWSTPIAYKATIDKNSEQDRLKLVSPIGHALFNYDNMYEDEQEKEWRRVCAIDKVRNQLPAYRVIPNLSHLTVLEIGCGDGSICLELFNNNIFKSYLGLEISKSGIVAARQKQIENAEFICLEAADIENFNYECELTLLCHVVEHLDNPRILIQRCKEWSPYLLVEVPLEDNLGMSEDYDWDPVGHINKFRTATIRHLLQTCGWEIIQSRIYNPSRVVRTFHTKSLRSNVVWLVKELALKLSKKKASRLFTYHYILLAKRSL